MLSGDVSSVAATDWIEPGSQSKAAVIAMANPGGGGALREAVPGLGRYRGNVSRGAYFVFPAGCCWVTQ
jgi:hypothetical protein